MRATRRTALAAIAAAIACPVVRLRKSIDAERLMLAFCDREEWHPKWNLKEPIAIGSLTYATDTRGMIRAELANRQIIDDKKLPPCTEVWNKYWHPSQQWMPLNQDAIRPVLTSRWPDCPECGCLATVCLGNEYPDFNDPAVYTEVHRYGYDSDTNSIRDKSCPVCHGLRYSGPSDVRVFGALHSSFLLKRIAALPNVMVCPSRANDDVLLFRADGFEGCQMALFDEGTNQ